MLHLRALSTSVILPLLAAATAPAQTVAHPDEMLAISLGAAPGTLDLSWFGHTGRSYFLMYSPTLDTGSWSYLPIIEPGTDVTLSYGATAPGEGERFFARTIVMPSTSTQPRFADFDGDGVSNMDELQAGLDPLSSVDSDDDGLPDDWEMFYFGDLSRDGTGDYDGDGVSDAAEYAAGRRPNTKIVYGTVLFYWKYEDAATKTVFFGDATDESTMVVTYSNTALTDVISIKLYTDTQPIAFINPLREPQNYSPLNPVPSPVVEYAATSPTDGAHSLVFTGHTVNYSGGHSIVRTGRDLLRKIDGRPYRYVTSPDLKRVATYSAITSAPLTQVTGNRFPAIYRDAPFTQDNSILAYQKYPDFGKHKNVRQTNNLLANTLSTAPITYWRQPILALWGAPSFNQIASPESFYLWYNSLEAISITLGVEEEQNLGFGYHYGFINYDMNLVQKNDVGHYWGGFGYTAELHLKLDYDVSNGPNQTRIQYESDDDFWLFINGKLVVDKGGISGFSGEIVLAEQDHGLVEMTGSCDVAIYHAERWGGGAKLILKSNTPLRPVYAYQLVVDTIRNLPPLFSLDTAPTGMSISPTGKIFWDYSDAPSNDYDVQVSVSDRNGNASTQAFTIALDNPLRVRALPEYANTVPGGSATLTAYITGAPAPTAYQWYQGETLLTGKTERILTITDAQYSNAGEYTVQVTNIDGIITSNTIYLDIYEIY